MKCLIKCCVNIASVMIWRPNINSYSQTLSHQMNEKGKYYRPFIILSFILIIVDIIGIVVIFICPSWTQLTVSIWSNTLISKSKCTILELCHMNNDLDDCKVANFPPDTLGAERCMFPYTVKGISYFDCAMFEESGTSKIYGCGKVCNVENISLEIRICTVGRATSLEGMRSFVGKNLIRRSMKNYRRCSIDLVNICEPFINDTSVITILVHRMKVDLSQFGIIYLLKIRMINMYRRIQQRFL